MSTANLNVEQLLSALQRKGIPLPFELGTFLVLQAAEQALVLEATEQGMAAPPLVGIADIWLGDDGEVGVSPSNVAETEQAACRALVVMLGEMLVRSAPGVPPMLLELVEHGPSDGEWSLLRLRDDLEASLVPLNRGALKRVLSRLLREVKRRETDRAAADSPDDGALDRDVDALFGGESAAAPAPASVARGPREALDWEEGGLGPKAPARGEDDDPAADGDDADDEEPEEPPTLRRPALGPSESEAPARRGGKRGPKLDATLDAFEHEAEPARGAGGRIGIALALVAAALGAAYLLLGRERTRGALGLATEAPPAPAPAAQSAPARKYGELRVTSTPERAQVLLYVGKGPVIVRDLPIGVTHEFVASDGLHAPARAVVAKDAAFQVEEGRARYELALQLGEADARHRPTELGATRLTQDVGSPNGQLGEVRVVTSPPGVRVYQLIGFTPDVRVENVAVGEPLELLVYLNGYEPSRIELGPDAWKEQAGKLSAELDVQLQRKSK